MDTTKIKNEDDVVSIEMIQSGVHAIDEILRETKGFLTGLYVSTNNGYTQRMLNEINSAINDTVLIVARLSKLQKSVVGLKKIVTEELEQTKKELLKYKGEDNDEE